MYICKNTVKLVFKKLTCVTNTQIQKQNITISPDCPCASFQLSHPNPKLKTIYINFANVNVNVVLFSLTYFAQNYF